MTLDVEALARLVKIIDGIQAGKPPPRVPGRVGQFLRMFHTTRFDIEHVLAREGIALRSAGWAPGDELGDVRVTLLADLEGAVPNDLWGPVEHAPALCEELGALVDLTLWTSARSANRVHVFGASGKGTAVRMHGAYRWFPPSRLTPGDADVEDSVSERLDWRRVRFLKATADDVGKPPHPLEYILDYRLGPPALKAFRVFAARRASTGGWDVLPGVTSSSRTVELRMPDNDGVIGDDELVLVFAYRDPWSGAWTSLATSPATDVECVAHALTWADFRAEVTTGGNLTPMDAEAVRRAALTNGVTAPSLTECLELGNFARQLVPAARAVARWLRYTK